MDLYIFVERKLGLMDSLDDFHIQACNLEVLQTFLPNIHKLHDHFECDIENWVHKEMVRKGLYADRQLLQFCNKFNEMFFNMNKIMTHVSMSTE